MKNIYAFAIGFFYSLTPLFAQTNDGGSKNVSIFDRLSKGMTEFKLDSSAAPDDKITRKIIELRQLKGGFNINEAIDYKIEEDRQKGEKPALEFSAFADYMQNGNGRKWLDNAVIWIYRQQFNYKELKQIVKFYKTDGGQKMAAQFPVVMMQSLAAAETIKKQYESQQQKK